VLKTEWWGWLQIMVQTCLTFPCDEYLVDLLHDLFRLPCTQRRFLTNVWQLFQKCLGPQAEQSYNFSTNYIITVAVSLKSFNLYLTEFKEEIRLSGTLWLGIRFLILLWYHVAVEDLTLADLWHKESYHIHKPNIVSEVILNWLKLDS
jgi:hypothetical protein